MLLLFNVTLSLELISIMSFFLKQSLFLYFIVGSMCSVLSAQSDTITSPPNVILIVADDMGWNDVSYHGSEINTPTIDRLAQSGVELNRFYVHPTCSPTRSSLMTGKAALRLGFLNPLGKNNKKGLPLSEKIMPEYFKELGYQTNLIGKWHLGRFTKEQWPYNRGFDHFYGYLGGGIGHYDHVHGGGLDWQRNGENLREEGYSSHLLTAEAIKIINDKPSDQPLFLEVCYAAPHLPNEAPESTVARHSHLPDEKRQLHAAMVSEVDKGIEQIYKALEDKGLLENSIIWFTSDNGGLNSKAVSKKMLDGINKLKSTLGTPIPIDFFEFFRRNIENGAADNSPLRRGKGSIYEGGVRVPSFIYAPHLLQARKVEDRLTVNDVLPTLAGAVGFDNFNFENIDGANQWAFLSGQTNQAIATNYITHSIDAEAYYKDNWKLIVPTDGEQELYNILIDPTESNNVIVENSDLATSMFKEYEVFPRGESVDDPMWKAFLDMDRFGGEENRGPYGGLEGVNKGPLHPIYYILPIIVLLFILFIWWKRKRRVLKRSNINSESSE